MSLRTLLVGSTAAIFGAGVVLASVGTIQAAMLTSPVKAPTYLQHVDCAVGAHIGPLGACIFGNDGPPPPAVVESPAPVVIERRAADAPVVDAPAPACDSTTINHTDANGNSVTKSRTSC